MADHRLDDAERAAIGAIARRAVLAAVESIASARPIVESSRFDVAVGRLAAPGACFVTLHARGELRGCIGSIEPRRSLADDVAENARAAMLDDLRFDPVRSDELSALVIEVSVLGPLEPLEASTRNELLGRLRPGIDGLVLVDGPRRATFLPSVWEQLREPEAFLSQLERKAGFESGGWSTTRRALRYGVESVEVGRALG